MASGVIPALVLWRATPTDGAALDRADATLGLGMLATVLIYGVCIIDRKRQGLHDKLAGTVVVRD
jgi:uncharacterized RDD family membrane protein YckC